ncbi:MAG TPA: bacterial transcriptional activator domain-containing protein, partial [Acidimicrobiales bacterium]|nr:bacterial transcriptional activator domain-containing protein [Acidimicrobiales bacterium]
VTLLPLGLRLQPASLPDELLDGVDELLTAALSDEPGDDLLAVCTRDVPSNGLERWPPLAPETPGVLVSVLGPVDVRGGERPIARRRSLELVVYLALHPEGVDEGRLRAVLWPESNPARENFNQTVSRARQPLGHASDGALHLPRLTDEESARYHLGPEVASDAALLEAAYVAARRGASEARIEHLASLLGMIRGIPFEGTKGGWQWTFTEGHAARLASLAADSAHLVAQWLLQRGEVQRALWATSQGLRAAPGDEVLYRDRMQAHDQTGNRSGVEAVMEELRRTVDDGEPYDSVHPDTVAYYEQLTQGVRRTG